MKCFWVSLIILPAIVSFHFDPPANPIIGKINGVNFVAPSKEMPSEHFNSLKKINAKWIALNPFAFAEPGNPHLKYDLSWQWWGETTHGVTKMVVYAKEQGYKVLIKPHIWVKNHGWAGDFELSNEDDWKKWEEDYESYILNFARVAQQYKVEMLCIGTEMKKSVHMRPGFWLRLIRNVRSLYKGKLIYAANWDNYQNIPFWGQLDYIGIDAYFPLSDKNTPGVSGLIEAWNPYINKLRSLHDKYDIPIIFTEYGYRSIDKTAWEQWTLKDDWRYNGKANHEAQINSYKAIYLAFWKQPWFAGGFIWKWYDNYSTSGGLSNTDYTPQNKPVEKLIREWYAR